jgi:hypothetical protein
MVVVVVKWITKETERVQVFTRLLAFLFFFLKFFPFDSPTFAGGNSSWDGEVFLKRRAGTFFLKKERWRTAVISRQQALQRGA